MRIGLFEISQETDTFNPQFTTLEDFASFGLYDGQAVVDNGRGEGRGLSTYFKTSGPPVSVTSMACMVTIRTPPLALCR